MLTKEIVFFGQKAVVGCDSKCEKAWGINMRPKVQLDEHNEDGYAYLADNELGTAPVNPGIYEAVAQSQQLKKNG